MTHIKDELESTFSTENDVREHLIQPQDRRHDQSAVVEDEDAFTHEELLHSIGSFSAVVWPVTGTMLLASFVSLNVVDPTSAAALADVYLVYNPDSDIDASNGTKFGEALVNALVIVSFFLVATFVIVACYKFNLTRLLIGYMMFSSVMLLGMLGGNILVIAMAQLQLVVDCISMVFTMYNFAVVGVIAIFYQKGTPAWLAQIYLVITSVIMAWQLGQFPEWSTWALVIVLAFYDLCAVLTPCGPLKWLVNLMQQEGRPLPGLLYAADIRREQFEYASDSHSDGAHTPVRVNVYYQCESEIPLRIGSTPENHVIHSATQFSTDPEISAREKRLRQRLIEFYSEHNPTAIARLDKILQQYRGREAELWHDLHQKYIVEEGDVDNTIKLGLGDFVFYSVLVSRAAKYDFSAMIACLVSILMGLGGTLFLLGIYKKALPALPISILIAVAVYFWTYGVFVDFASSALDLGIQL